MDKGPYFLRLSMNELDKVMIVVKCMRQGLQSQRLSQGLGFPCLIDQVYGLLGSS